MTCIILQHHVMTYNIIFDEINKELLYQPNIASDSALLGFYTSATPWGYYDVLGEAAIPHPQFIDGSLIIQIYSL